VRKICGSSDRGRYHHDNETDTHERNDLLLLILPLMIFAIDAAILIIFIFISPLFRRVSLLFTITLLLMLSCHFLSFLFAAERRHYASHSLF
jgi:hypothetical protein